MSEMSKNKGIGLFEKYLTLWVAACIIVGIAIGKWWFIAVSIVFLLWGFVQIYGKKRSCGNCSKCTTPCCSGDASSNNQ